MEKLSDNSVSDELIVPTEFAVCATCGFWDGQRRVDEEAGLVVVKQDLEGECLLRSISVPGLFAASLASPELQHQCEWEPIEGDPLDPQSVEEVCGSK